MYCSGAPVVWDYKFKSLYRSYHFWQSVPKIDEKCYFFINYCAHESQSFHWPWKNSSACSFCVLGKKRKWNLNIVSFPTKRAVCIHLIPTCTSLTLLFQDFSLLQTGFHSWKKIFICTGQSPGRTNWGITALFCKCHNVAPASTLWTTPTISSLCFTLFWSDHLFTHVRCSVHVLLWVGHPEITGAGWMKLPKK